MTGGDYPETEHGWSSGFTKFSETPAPYIRQSLVEFLKNSSPEQLRAWDLSIPPLQSEVGQVLDRDPNADGYSAILEYQLPMEHRRPDVILLMGGGVLVLELKGKSHVDLADIDQAAAYARDLRAYHKECDGRPVYAALMLMNARGRLGSTAGVEVIGPDALDDLASDLDARAPSQPISRPAFLNPDAYRPLPTIVAAARELMATGEIRRIHKAAAATKPTLEAITQVAHVAAQTRTRHLVLLSGLPGTGKTLVGLQLAHARFLDDISVERSGGKPTAPAVYLSGNGPLVQVLQYELKGAGGGGATFVRPVKAYVERYMSRPSLIPREHVLVFDEAQRAFDVEMMAKTHGTAEGRKSEPDHFIEFAERVPEWCLVVGLIGAGQEIHVGEEAGIGQWRTAIERSADAGSWTVHLPPNLASAFNGMPNVREHASLHLSVELRYHLAEDVHRHVAGLLDDASITDLDALANRLEMQGYPLRITRDLNEAKEYLRERYRESPDSRFGMLASSRDSSVSQFGIPNDYQSTKQVRFGAWFAEGDDDPLGRSCRALRTCVTEFGCQGLELDASLLAWGTDFVRTHGRWSNQFAKRYQSPGQVHDAMQLRRNAYRVLLTRARETTVVFVPPLPALDETFQFLLTSGFRPLQRDHTQELLPGGLGVAGG